MGPRPVKEHEALVNDAVGPVGGGGGVGRKALGDRPRNQLSIFAGEPLEGR